MSLLDSNLTSSAQELAPGNSSVSTSLPLQNFVSQYQTSIFPTTSSTTNTHFVNGVPQLVVNSNDKNQLTTDTSKAAQGTSETSSPKAQKSTKSSTFLSEHIKRFQTSFQIPTLAPSPSKTSIKSIINADSDSEVIEISSRDSTPIPANAPATNSNPTPPAKRKPAKKKDDAGSKRKKVEPKKLDKDGKPEPKKSKSRRKTPEANKALDTGPTPHPLLPTLTTEKSTTTSRVKLLAPTIVDLLNDPRDENPNTESPNAKTKKSEPATEKDKEEKEKEKEKREKERAERERAEKEKVEKEKVPPLIIALNVPLLDPKDPKPGQSEVVVNVLKLAEEKYGWSALHPNAKSAIDIMDDILDEDDDAMEEDEDDDDDEEEKSKKKKDDEGLTEEQLVRQHEIRMNRRVGKYDYEDPFIDDIELHMEEEITTTKEGFFVYWGPIVDDRSSSSKKGSSKKR